MFPTKGIKPVKASIDSILDTAKTATETPDTTSPPAATPSSAGEASSPSSPAPISADPPAPSAPAPSNQPTSAPTSPILGAVQRPFLRPTAPSRPSWIGPPRPATPGFQAMRQPVTIEYASAGLQPPVYVFTSLSDPQWDAVEMEYSKKDNGDFNFRKSFAADEGEYQYKFRLGPGDWWALDDSKPTVDDGQGNKNNLMVVKPPASEVQSQSQPQQVAAPTSTHEQPKSIDAAPAPAPVVEKLKQQETSAERPNAVSTPSAAADPKPEPVPTPQPGPIMKHESFFPETAPGAPQDVDDNDGAIVPEQDDDDDDDDEDDYLDHPSPLLRHETLGRDAEEQHQAPLMRHESKGIGEHDDELDPYLHDLHRRQSVDSDPSDAISPEADPNDPTLEPFPTDPAAIHEHIRRLSTSMPADQTADGIDTGSPLSLARSTTSLSPVRSLASVREEDEEEDEGLATLRNTERQQAHRELETGEEMDPGTDVPEVKVMEPDGGFVALITPPMTPEEGAKVLEVVEGEGVIEAIVERVMGQQEKEADGGEEGAEKRAEKGEEVVVEIVQQRGLMSVMADIVAHPFSWLAIAGVAIALAGGIWKVRYA